MAALLSWRPLLTHWGRVTRICNTKLTTIASDNGLSPGRHHAIIWTNAGILLIEPLEINFSEVLIEINTFAFKKMHLKVSSAKWWRFCLGLEVLSEPTIWQAYNRLLKWSWSMVWPTQSHSSAVRHMIVADFWACCNIFPKLIWH